MKSTGSIEADEFARHIQSHANPPRMDLPVLAVTLKARQAVRAVLALLVGLGGGYAFLLLSLPLPWTLGSLAAAAILSIAGINWRLPTFSKDFARPTVGVMAGSAFTLPVVVSMLEWWAVIPFLLLFTIFITLAGWLFFTRICRMDGMTAVFASTPGGLGELTLLGAQFGAEMRTLVLVHSVRVITVVSLVPFIVQLLVEPSGGQLGILVTAAPAEGSVPEWSLLIACAVVGYLIGRKFSRVGGVLIAPLLLSGLAHSSGLTDIAPPTWLVILMQVVIGSLAGSRFAGVGGKELRSTVLQGFAWAVLMLATAISFATLAALFVDTPLAALVLAFSPGGFPEMTIVAYTIGIEVAFVVTCHALRIIAVLLLATTLANVLPRRAPCPARAC